MWPTFGIHSSNVYRREHCTWFHMQQFRFFNKDNRRTFFPSLSLSTETLAHGLSFCDPHPSALPLCCLLQTPGICNCLLESNGTIHCGHMSNIRWSWMFSLPISLQCEQPESTWSFTRAFRLPKPFWIEIWWLTSLRYCILCRSFISDNCQAPRTWWSWSGTGSSKMMPLRIGLRPQRSCISYSPFYAWTKLDLVEPFETLSFGKAFASNAVRTVSDLAEACGAERT